MLLQEIINAPPLPYKWLTTNTCSFVFNNTSFGIVLEPMMLTLVGGKQISVVNISFGVVKDINQPISPKNLNLNLTGFGSPRTVMSTVAAACTDNKTMRTYDMFVVAASEQVTRRVGMYTLAISQLDTNLHDLYKFSYRAHTPNGTTLIVSSKIELSQEEIEYVGKEILGK